MRVLNPCGHDQQSTKLGAVTGFVKGDSTTVPTERVEDAEFSKVYDLSTERHLIHEVAHERSAHHGLSYIQAMEEVAGIAAELVLKKRDFISSSFGDLMC
jgi:hypothetical protein